MVSLFDGEPGTLCDVTKHLNGESDQKGLPRIEVEFWELVDSSCLQFSNI
jgi:hypothetical protein